MLLEGGHELVDPLGDTGIRTSFHKSCGLHAEQVSATDNLPTKPSAKFMELWYIVFRMPIGLWLAVE